MPHHVVLRLTGVNSYKAPRTKPGRQHTFLCSKAQVKFLSHLSVVTVSLQRGDLAFKCQLYCRALLFLNERFHCLYLTNGKSEAPD